MTDISLDTPTAADADAIVALLTASSLPPAGALDHLDTAVVARRDGAVVGFAALEVYDDGALLRSVAVADAERGSGIGRAVVEAALDLAARLGARPVFLLTETAADYFPRFGFSVVSRGEVPPGVRQAEQFGTCCCSTAAVMRRAG